MLNVIRGLLREFGHVIGNGPVAAMRFVTACQAGDFPDITELLKSVLKILCDRVIALADRVAFYDKLIDHHSRIDERATRLRTTPGYAPL